MKYYFVIDTDSYSGNFERELCAYITGQTGECGVGIELATTAEEELGHDFLKFDGMVCSEPDENGCRRPVKIYPSPNTGKYQSVAISLFDRPPQDTIDLIKKRAEAYCKACRDGRVEEIGGRKGRNYSVNIIGFRLVMEKTTIEEEKL